MAGDGVWKTSGTSRRHLHAPVAGSGGSPG